MDKFCDRLKQAMNIRDLKAADLSKLSGLSKAQISQYVNGKYEAKQEALYKLAKTLNVSEAWLMGHEVPMDRYVIDFDSSAMSGLFAMPQSFYADLAQTITDNALETAFTDLCGDADDETIELITELLHEVKAMSKDQIRQILKYAKFIKAE